MTLCAGGDRATVSTPVRSTASRCPNKCGTRSVGDDVIRGVFDSDRIAGGAGDDRVLGGSDIDTYVFDNGFDADRILDFSPFRETLDFSEHAGFSGLEDLDIRRIAGSTVISDGEGGRIVHVGIDAARISEGDFRFA